MQLKALPASFYQAGRFHPGELSAKAKELYGWWKRGRHYLPEAWAAVNAAWSCRRHGPRSTAGRGG